MPYKFYHGRTGRIFNIGKRAVGVEVTKQVRLVFSVTNFVPLLSPSLLFLPFFPLPSNRVINKRIHVRTEHINPSRCREDFYARLKENKAKRTRAHEEKRRIQVE